MDIRLKPAEGIMTAEIQSAIDRISLYDGGRLILSGGCFHSGTLFMKSGVELCIEKGSTLKASTSLSDYSPDVHHNRYRNETNIDLCLIYAQNAENISFTGAGTIDGSNEAFTETRPMLIRMYHCRNIRLEGLTLLESAAWNVALLNCEQVIARRLTIYNTRRFNGDGIDCDDTRNVLIEDCTFTTTDDSICAQSSGEVCEDILIRRCHFSSICAALRFGLKSIGTIRNIRAEDCSMDSVMAEGVKIECSEGGDIYDIHIRNIRMHNVRRPLYFILNNRFQPEGLGSSIELDHMPQIGRLYNIAVEEITAEDDDEMLKEQWRFTHNVMGDPAFSGCRIDANINHRIENLTIRGFHYKAIGSLDHTFDDYPVVPDLLIESPEVYVENYEPRYNRSCAFDIRNVHNLSLEDISLETRYPDARPLKIIEGCD